MQLINWIWINKLNLKMNDFTYLTEEEKLNADNFLNFKDFYEANKDKLVPYERIHIENQNPNGR